MTVPRISPAAPTPRKKSPLWRVLALTACYAVVIAAIFLLQYFPYTGIFLMMVGASRWIGVVVHIFILHIAFEALTRRLPRWMLIVPGLFYTAGVGLGLYSDVMVHCWKGAQEWLRIDKQIPADVRFLVFEPWNMVEGANINDPKGAFRPATLGYELAWVALRPNWGVRENTRLVFHSPADPWCFRRGEQVWKIGDRCFKKEAIERPAAFLRIGGAPKLEGPSDPVQWPPPRFFWGTTTRGR